jgi:hypothetical protein
LTAVSGSSIAKARKFRVEESVERSVASGVNDIVGDDDVAATTLRSLCGSKEKDKVRTRKGRKRWREN